MQYAHMIHITITYAHMIHITTTYAHMIHITIAYAHMIHITLTYAHMIHITITYAHMIHITIAYAHMIHITITYAHMIHINTSGFLKSSHWLLIIPIFSCHDDKSVNLCGGSCDHILPVSEILSHLLSSRDLDISKVCFRWLVCP